MQDIVGDAGHVSALDLRVVLNAHPGQSGDFRTPQSGHAPSPPRQQAHLLGGDSRPSAHQEVLDVLGNVHLPRIPRQRANTPTRPTDRWSCIPTTGRLLFRASARGGSNESARSIADSYPDVRARLRAVLF